MSIQNLLKVPGNHTSAPKVLESDKQKPKSQYRVSNVTSKAEYEKRRKGHVCERHRCYEKGVQLVQSVPLHSSHLSSRRCHQSSLSRSTKAPVGRYAQLSPTTEKKSPTNTFWLVEKRKRGRRPAFSNRQSSNHLT